MHIYLKTKKECWGHLPSEKPTVLIFYRGGWCPYCMKHLQAPAGIERICHQVSPGLRGDELRPKMATPLVKRGTLHENVPSLARLLGLSCLRMAGGRRGE
jgi:hypothetical protein